MFGNSPSEPAQKATELFEQEGLHNVLELGAGMGRDTKLFALHGFKVTAVDYAPGVLSGLKTKLTNLNLTDSVDTIQADVRKGLPFSDASFDACYSHMLFCMALTMAELELSMREVHRVLRPGGLCIYTARHKGDSHFGVGVHHGEDLYELNGFIIHFFDSLKLTKLAEGFEVVDIEKFEEGSLPRRLYLVILRKMEN